VKGRWVAPSKDVTHLARVAGHPALDFANTLSWRGQPRAIDYLRDYRALIAWARGARLLTPRQADRLARAARRQPARAAAALARARALRETVYRIGSAIARGRDPRSADLARLHVARLAALRHARLAPAGGHAWAPEWDEAPRLDRPWWPLACAVASLLEHPLPHPLGRCPDCAWLFLDSSRNRSRRWCSSGDCGNRARGQRFRDRHIPS
jgi:predicted RNA-binding Zn ribbon-like protein